MGLPDHHAAMRRTQQWPPEAPEYLQSPQLLKTIVLVKLALLKKIQKVTRHVQPKSDQAGILMTGLHFTRVRFCKDAIMFWQVVDDGMQDIWHFDKALHFDKAFKEIQASGVHFWMDTMKGRHHFEEYINVSSCVERCAHPHFHRSAITKHAHHLQSVSVLSTSRLQPMTHVLHIPNTKVVQNLCVFPARSPRWFLNKKCKGRESWFPHFIQTNEQQVTHRDCNLQSIYD